MRRANNKNRFGVGATREVGMDLADWGAKYLLLILFSFYLLFLFLLLFPFSCSLFLFLFLSLHLCVLFERFNRHVCVICDPNLALAPSSPVHTVLQSLSDSKVS